jgi:hypothetical protein
VWSAIQDAKVWKWVEAEFVARIFLNIREMETYDCERVDSSEI